MTKISSRANDCAKHSFDVNCLLYHNKKLYSAGDDGKIKVRLFKNDQLYSLLNVLEPVKDLYIIGNLLYTVRDLDLAITEMSPGDKGRFATKKTLPGRAPFSIVEDKIFISSRGGNDILLYDNCGDYKQVTEVKDAHSMNINALCGVKSSNKILLYSGGWDKVVKQWTIANGSIKLLNECAVDIVVNCFTLGAKGELYAGGSDGHIVGIDV